MSEAVITIPVSLLAQLQEVIDEQEERILVLQRIVNGEDNQYADPHFTFTKVSQYCDTDIDFRKN